MGGVLFFRVTSDLRKLKAAGMCVALSFLSKALLLRRKITVSIFSG